MFLRLAKDPVEVILTRRADRGTWTEGRPQKSRSQAEKRQTRQPQDIHEGAAKTPYKVHTCTRSPRGPRGWMTTKTAGKTAAFAQNLPPIPWISETVTGK